MTGKRMAGLPSTGNHTSLSAGISSDADAVTMSTLRPQRRPCGMLVRAKRANVTAVRIHSVQPERLRWFPSIRARRHKDVYLVLVGDVGIGVKISGAGWHILSDPQASRFDDGTPAQSLASPIGGMPQVKDLAIQVPPKGAGDTIPHRRQVTGERLEGNPNALR